LNPPVRPEDRISTNTFELLSNIKNDDVIWNGGYLSLMPVKLTGATLVLLDVQEDINPLLIDALAIKDKFVAAHILLTLRTSSSFAAKAGDWNGLKVEIDSNGIASFDGNNLQELQEYWRGKLNQ